MAGKSYVSGFKEANQVLKGLEDAMRDRVLQQATFAGAGVIRDEVKANAPRGGTGKKRSPKSKQFGRLRLNLKIRPMTKMPPNVKGALIVTGKSFWGLFYERGTAHQPARPFFRPAFDRMKDAALAKVGAALFKAIDREATRLANKAGIRKGK